MIQIKMTVKCNWTQDEQCTKKEPIDLRTREDQPALATLPKGWHADDTKALCPEHVQLLQNNNIKITRNLYDIFFQGPNIIQIELTESTKENQPCK